MRGIQPQIAIIASYLSTNGRNNDFSLLAASISHHSQFKQLKNSALSLYAELLHGSLERGDQTDNENRLHVGANLRLEIQTNLEMAADISYTTLYDNDLQFTPAIILHIATETSDSDTLIFAARILLK